MPGYQKAEKKEKKEKKENKKRGLVSLRACFSTSHANESAGWHVFSLS
jgi:hypothetical protein